MTPGNQEGPAFPAAWVPSTPCCAPARESGAFRSGRNDRIPASAEFTVSVRRGVRSWPRKIGLAGTEKLLPPSACATRAGPGRAKSVLPTRKSSCHHQRALRGPVPAAQNRFCRHGKTRAAISLRQAGRWRPPSGQPRAPGGGFAHIPSWRSVREARSRCLRRPGLWGNAGSRSGWTGRCPRWV